MTKLKYLLRRKYVVDKTIEAEMYTGCGPSDEDFMEQFETQYQIEIEELKIILNYYRELTGDLSNSLNKLQEDTDAKQES